MVKKSILYYHRYFLKNKASDVILLLIKVLWLLGSYERKFTFLRPSQKDFANINLAFPVLSGKLLPFQIPPSPCNDSLLPQAEFIFVITQCEFHDRISHGRKKNV